MILSDSPRRLGIYFFFDAAGIVDSYVETMLADMTNNLDDLTVVVNGKLTEAGRSVFSRFTDKVLVRDNVGLDVWAYKEAMAAYGWDELSRFDEIVLFNSTIMGPVFPFSEMFTEMNSRDLDFWGITWFHEYPDGDPFGYSPYGYLPRHLQTHFHVYRSSLVSSAPFQKYWDEMPMIHSYQESVGRHEAVFTKHFEDLGFEAGAYVDTSELEDLTLQPIVFAAKKLIEEYRCPIFKRRSFFHDYQDVLDQSIGTASRDLYEFLRDHTEYDTNQIWDNLLRTVNLASLVDNLQLTEVLPSKAVLPPAGKPMRVALVAHVYYMYLLPEVVRYARSMPADADIIVTVGDEEKVSLIREAFAELPNRLVVKVIENRGRDVAALLIGARDDLKQYDLACFIHDKKVSQVKPGTVGEGFGRKCLDNVLLTPEFVRNVITTFAMNDRLGVMMPMPPNHGDYFPNFTNTWGPNFENTRRLLHTLKVDVPLDPRTPAIAPFGSTFWFRPQATGALFDKKWAWTDFPREPLPVDGTISHAIERAHCYVAQGAGYYSSWLCADEFARLELTNLAFYTRQLTNAMTLHWGAGKERELLSRANDPNWTRRMLKQHVKKRVPKKLVRTMRVGLHQARRVRRLFP